MGMEEFCLNLQPTTTKELPQTRKSFLEEEMSVTAFSSHESTKGCLLYLFPRAAVTNHHKPGNTKQWEFILSQFWNSEVQYKCVSGQGCALSKAAAENPSPSPPAVGSPRRSLTSLACGHLPLISASTVTKPSLLCVFSSLV